MKLEEIAQRYDPSDPNQFEYYLKHLHIQCVQAWLRGDSVLEMGCATGESTSLLAPFCASLDVVEGSEHNATATHARVPEATIYRSLWEEFIPTHPYSDIVLSGTLEHTEFPCQLLTHLAPWLEPNGRMHILVPNGLSFHRLLGVELGLLAHPLDLTEEDRAQGHYRNYCMTTLLNDVSMAGLRAVHQQPIYLKIVPNAEMVGWSWGRIEALHRMAQQFPNNGAELYVVAERN